MPGPPRFPVNSTGRFSEKHEPLIIHYRFISCPFQANKRISRICLQRDAVICRRRAEYGIPAPVNGQIAKPSMKSGPENGGPEKESRETSSHDKRGCSCSLLRISAGHRSLLFEPLVALPRQPRPEGLYHLGNNHQNNHRQVQHRETVPLITVGKGKLSQSASANSS